MRLAANVVILLVLLSGVATSAAAGPASGTVKSATGVISPKFATAYVVRDTSGLRVSRSPDFAADRRARGS